MKKKHATSKRSFKIGHICYVGTSSLGDKLFAGF